MSRRKRKNILRRLKAYITRIIAWVAQLPKRLFPPRRGKQEPPEGAEPCRREKPRPAILAVDLLLLVLLIASAVFFLSVRGMEDGQIDVSLQEGRKIVQYRIWPDTVAGFLSTASIRLEEGDEISPALTDALAQGDTIHITRAFPVAVQSAGKVSLLHVTGGTVGSMLEMADVQYKAGDELSALSFADVAAGMKITHTQVAVSYAVSYKTLDYDQVVIKDDKEYESFKEVEVEGQDGKKQITQEITVKDGLKVGRKVVDQIVVEPAVDEVVRVGTKIHYQTNYVGETRRWKEAPVDGENGWKKVTVDKITAYCTGTRTATGTTPKLGTIAVNPYYFSYGTQFYIKKYGYGAARDTGAFRNYTNSKGEPMNQLDIWFNTEREARNWGTKYNVTIWVKE